jgi:hypothetical protein
MNDRIKKTKNDKRLYDILIGIILCAFSITVFIFSFSLEKKAGMFPIFITLGLVFFSGLSVVRNIYLLALKGENKSENIRSGASERMSQIVKSLKNDLYPLLVSGLCMIFVLLYPVIGFEISAFMLLFFTMAIIDLKEAIRKIYISIIVPAALIAIFYYGLKLRMPLLFDNIFGK